ncbi:MAG: hypothetical protein II114_03830 [Treponema sp.]|nr:hypothetical protein [Treponema sp.]
MKISKWLVTGALSLTVIAAAAALTVNIDEIRSTSGEVISFDNYSGPHALIETADAITEIGRNLGRQVAKNVNDSATYGRGAKYSVIHAVDSSESQKLDADIFILNGTASVDHITNLRRILIGYLTTAYGYEKSDASTIATFITVYNAVYRQNLAVFKAKYKDAVVKNLTEDKCGLSTKWSEWPGNTQIVIPLYDVNGGLSTVDTSIISDSNVINSMREEDNRGVDERQNMVDIKEREASNFADQAQKAASDAAELNRQLEQQKAVSDKANEDAKKAQQTAQQAKAASDANPENEALKQRAEISQAAANQAKEKADAEKQKTDEQKQAVQQAEQQAAKAQSSSDKKLSEAKKERTEIAKDQQKTLEQALADGYNRNAVVGLKLVDDDKLLTGLVKIDSTTGEILDESPVTVIRGRTIIPVMEDSNDGDEAGNIASYVAICGDNNASNRAVKLCLLDALTLELMAEGNEIVAEDSVLVKYGDDFYCVIQNGNGWSVAKYDSSLKLLLKSPVSVRPDTPITVTSKGIVVTTASNQVALLNLKDLSSVTSLK